MSANSGVETEALGEASLLSFELVFNDDESFISLNGECLPSMCDGFKLNEAGCFVLRQGRFEFVTQPIPAQVIPVYAALRNVLFVQFLPNGEMDGKDLPHIDFIGKE